MTIPMIILAFGSVFAGGLFSINCSFLHWLEPVTGHSEGNSPVSAWDGHRRHHGACWSSAPASPGCMYGRQSGARRVAPRGSLLTRAARRDLLQDDFNHVVLVRGGEHLTRSLVYLDHTLVDGVGQRHRRLGRRPLRPAAQAAERLRPLLRGLDVRRYGGAGRRDPADEGGLMTCPFLSSPRRRRSRRSARSSPPRVPGRAARPPPNGWRWSSRSPPWCWPRSSSVRFDAGRRRATS